MEVTTRLIIIEEHINALKEAHWDVKVIYQSGYLELYPKLLSFHSNFPILQKNNLNCQIIVKISLDILSCVYSLLK